VRCYGRPARAKRAVALVLRASAKRAYQFSRNRPDTDGGSTKRRTASLRPGRKLGRVAALDEVGDDERDDYDNDRECQKPGPSALSCEEHIDLHYWVRPIRKRPCAPSIYVKERRGEARLSLWGHVRRLGRCCGSTRQGRSRVSRLLTTPTSPQTNLG
jgi:hypothetical protein